jgi:hypothetical protein
VLALPVEASSHRFMPATEEAIRRDDAIEVMLGVALNVPRVAREIVEGRIRGRVVVDL